MTKLVTRLITPSIDKRKCSSMTRGSRQDAIIAESFTKAQINAHFQKKGNSLGSPLLAK